MFELLLGAIIGVIVTVILEKPVRRFFSKLSKSFYRFYYRIVPVKSKMTATFSFGIKPTEIIIIDGNGKLSYAPNDIISTIVPSPIQHIQEFAIFHSQFIDELKEKQKKGIAVPWNGSLLSLHKFGISRTQNDEAMKLRLFLYKTDYYTVSTIINNLCAVSPTGKKLNEYINAFSFDSMDAYPLPNGIGICMSVITKDRKIIFAKRSSSSGFRSSESDISIVEGINPSADVRNNSVDFRNVAVRAFFEEICETSEENLDINILGFVFDKKYNQWNIIGSIDTSLTQQDIIFERNTGTVGKWELSAMDFIKLDLKEIMLYCASHKMWDMALITLYFTLVFNGFNKKAINQSIAKYLNS